MAFPVYIHLFGRQIHPHLAMEALAYLAGFSLYLVLRRRFVRGPALTLNQTLWILVGAVFGALIGAKCLAWAEALPEIWAHRDDWRALVGGKTIVGALLGGWTGVQLVKRALGLAHPNGDIYVFPVILGVAIGRVGCFLTGLADRTYGLPTALPWGVDFGDGPRHPTQLYEIGFLLLAGGVFLARIITGRQRGCMFSQFMLAYLAWRFCVEFLKPRYTIPYLPLSPIQLATLPGMVYTYFHWSDQCCGPRPAASPIDPPAPTAAGSVTLELTSSLCPVCLGKIDAKIVHDADGIYLQKFCPAHGPQRVLIADDAAYYRRARTLAHRPPTAPPARQAAMRRGCPYDCGLCLDHEQHTCLAIVEITDRCDLACPICYAASGPAGTHRSLAQVEAMLDAATAAGPGVIQISGGEPTLHPDFFAILDAAKARQAKGQIRHLMLNTNGRRIADDPAFAARLATYAPAFEVYLQFDSLRPATLARLRGVDLSDTRRRALEALNRHHIATTLVVALEKGLNDAEIGEILAFAAAQPCVRGVTFQPLQHAGRAGRIEDPSRLTLTEIRRAILTQSRLFTARDLVPIPCHPDALAMAYALRRGERLVPLSALLDPAALADAGGDTICYEQDPALRRHVQSLIAASPTPAGMAQSLHLQCCLPLLPGPGSPIAYDQVFRVIIMAFMDAHTMDLRSLKRSCVHIVHPDGRLIPFETYNLLHRPRLVPQLEAVS